MWEAEQIRIEGVQACPVGFNTWYTDMVGVENYIEAANATDQKYNFDAKRGVLAAWGARWGQLDKRIQSRVCCFRTLIVPDRHQ